MITFLLNDKLINTSLSPATTVLDFVRYESGLRGTKIGCREGDCGACTVLIGALKGGELNYMSVTSCLTPISNVHGKHVVTVEGVNFKDLNRVQQAIVSHSGTQCGFCTPGFVTSLIAFAISYKTGSGANDAIASIDGNICRCTGYKSLEKAAVEIAEALKQKDQEHPFEWLVQNNFLPDYFLTVKESLKQIPAMTAPKGRIPVGGGTDIYVQRFDDVTGLDIEYLFDNSGLTGITERDGICTVPASSTMTDIMNCALIRNSIPHWTEFMKLVSSTPIRNIATVAGNLANASPIGDLTIMLLALDAAITLQDSTGRSRQLLLRDFYTGYKQLSKHDDEIITHISFTLPADNTVFNFEKVCKRKFLDIASVNSAVSLRLDGDRIISAHCSAGGVSPVPLYLKKTSEVLTGSKVSPQLVKSAAEILSAEITPISDARGSADYKRLLARQLFFSHFIHLFPEKIHLSKII